MLVALPAILVNKAVSLGIMLCLFSIHGVRFMIIMEDVSDRPNN